MKIKQIGQFENVKFSEGDVLKVIQEIEGTKNVSIGKFVRFGYSGRFIRSLKPSKASRKIVLRILTSCRYEERGLIEIDENIITDIKKYKEEKQ